MNTLTNMLHGALGALVLLVLVIPGVQFTLRQLGRLRGATRRLVRQTLGLEHFEGLMLDEVRSDRAEMTVLRREVERLDRHISDTRSQTYAQRDAVQTRNARLNMLKREVEELGLLLRQYTDALGPMWTTATGHSMPLRLLSTPHLQNIRNGDFGNSTVRLYIQRELERRRIDTAWRVRQQNGEKMPTKADYANGRAPIDPRLPFSYTPEVAARVARTLPLWAQDLIGDLVQANPRSVTREEQRRVKRLPLWAQQTIADLRQPR